MNLNLNERERERKRERDGGEGGEFGLVCFALIWFSGISTIVSYLMPSPVFAYTLNI